MIESELEQGVGNVRLLREDCTVYFKSKNKATEHGKTTILWWF